MPSAREVLDHSRKVFGVANSSHGAEAWSTRTLGSSEAADTGPRRLPRRWRPLVKPVSSAAVAVTALGLLLAWMGGALRGQVRPGELSPARPSAAGRTVVAVERVRGEETATAVGSVQ